MNQIVNNQGDCKYDVVIPYHVKDALPVQYCIKSCLKNFTGLNNIYVIGIESPRLNHICFRKEDDFLSGGLNKRYIEDRWRKIGFAGLNLSGWLYQQFIKLGCVYAIKELCENYIVVDSDVVFLKPLEFYKDGKCLLSHTREFFEPDFLCCEYLLGIKADRNFSFIAHHMPMKKRLVREMLGEIEKRHNEPWFDVIIKSFADGKCRFSEYQLYGQYLHNRHQDKILIRKLRYLQRYKLKYFPLVFCGAVDYMVFHSHKNPTINHRMSRWKYNLFLKYAAKKTE